MFNDGMTPVVSPSLREMMENAPPRIIETTTARNVRVSCHFGSCDASSSTLISLGASSSPEFAVSRVERRRLSDDSIARKLEFVEISSIAVN